MTTADKKLFNHINITFNCGFISINVIFYFMVEPTAVQSSECSLYAKTEGMPQSMETLIHDDSHCL